MKFIFTSIFLLATTFLSAQTKPDDCPQYYQMRVIASSGLNMRAAPSLSAKVVTRVPYDSLLRSCQQTAGSLTYQDIKGHWRQSEYRGQRGYMFDGFLEIVKLEAPDATPRPVGDPQAEPPVQPKAKPDAQATPPAKEEQRQYQLATEHYNFCGEVKQIDPGLIWYGFYPSDEDQRNESIIIRQTELEVVLSKARSTKGLEFDIRTQEGERSLFLLGTDRPLPLEELELEDPGELLRYTNNRIFPGQELRLTQGRDQPSLRLSATGSVEKAGDCPEIKNYRLQLTGDYQQDLNALLPETGKCGMPEVFWFGDLNTDGIPDIIFVVLTERATVFSLLMSDATQKAMPLQPAARWTIEKCN